MRNIQDLIKRTKEVANSGLPFMEGREKAQPVKEGTLTIKDYGYMVEIENGKEKEYVAFICEEDEKQFYFGNSVLTEQFKKLETEFSKEELEQLLEYGISVSFEVRTGKASGRQYVNTKLFA